MPFLCGVAFWLEEAFIYCNFDKTYWWRGVEDVAPYKKSNVSRVFCLLKGVSLFARMIQNNFCRGRRPRRPAKRTLIANYGRATIGRPLLTIKIKQTHYAQDDIQRFCLAICVRKTREFPHKLSLGNTKPHRRPMSAVRLLFF